MDHLNVKVDVLRDIYTAISGLFKQGLNATSTALEASRIIKGGPGTLYKLVVYNDKASAQYIQIHNTATLPADGAVPIVTFQVATKTTLDFPIHNIKGLNLSTGITVCNSSTAATKTIGSADCWFSALFI